MNYEQKYKEALERANMIYNDKYKPEIAAFAKKSLETIFPELAETDSDDERIRKAISQCVEDMRGLFEKLYRVHHEDAIEWLEKQGEQKPVDKVEPKFHEGDWVVNKLGDLWYIDSFDKKNYQVSDGKGNYNYFPISKQDEMRLWSIEDAKEGDVLANDYHILILKELSYDWSSNGTPNSVKAYCGIKPNGSFEIGKDNWCFCGTLNIHPATKEQRDLLFQKMKETGYEWDANKKELKKIEDSVEKALLKAGYEWSEDTHQLYKIEPKFKVGDWIVGANNVCKIISLNNELNCYIAVTINNEEVKIPYCFDDGQGHMCSYHLWSIEDAKDGDVLASGQVVFMFKMIHGVWLYCYCSLHNDGSFIADTYDLLTEKYFSEVHPATKEQRDLLFQKMKETGYEWDNVNKALKEIAPKFKVGDWVVDKNGLVKQILSYKDGVYKHTDGYSAKIFEDEWRMWTIQDAKDGDVLFLDFMSGKTFIYNGLTPDTAILFSFIISNDGEDVLPYDIGKPNVGIGYIEENKDIIHPATKEQRDLLFQKMHEEGYEWDSEKKEVKRVVIGPKFKVGDWITCKEFNTLKIIGIVEDRYEVELLNGFRAFPHIDYINKFFHLWTIQDAKDGDVLVCDVYEEPFIFKGLLDPNHPNYPVAYCGIDPAEAFCVSVRNYWWTYDNVKPATKEQREYLFKKMHEDGYEWDSEKKEVKRVETKGGEE